MNPPKLVFLVILVFMAGVGFSRMGATRMTVSPVHLTTTVDAQSPVPKNIPSIITIPSGAKQEDLPTPGPEEEDVVEYATDNQEMITRHVKGVLYTVNRNKLCKNQAKITMREWQEGFPTADLGMALARCVDNPLCHSVACAGKRCFQNVAACMLGDNSDDTSVVYVNIARTPKKLYLRETLLSGLTPLSELQKDRVIASSDYLRSEKENEMRNYDQPELMRREWSHENNPPYIEVTKGDFQRMCDTAGYIDPRHKLVMFVIPKVASTGLRRLYDRLVGHEDITLDANSTILMHKRDNDPTRERLAFRNFNITVMNQVMNDPSYRKVLFLRDPATRLLSCYLHLFKKQSQISLLREPNYAKQFKKQTLEWDEFTEATMQGEHGTPPYGNGEGVNAHYRQQAITGHIYKFIPLMDYIGWANSDHIRKMLEKYNLWEQFGATGWGSRGGFMAEAKYHETGAAKKKESYFTEIAHKRISKGYRMDYAMLENVGLTSADSPPTNGYRTNPYISVCKANATRPACLPGVPDANVVRLLKEANNQYN